MMDSFLEWLKILTRRKWCDFREIEGGKKYSVAPLETGMLRY